MAHIPWKPVQQVAKAVIHHWLSNIKRRQAGAFQYQTPAGLGISISNDNPFYGDMDVVITAPNLPFIAIKGAYGPEWGDKRKPARWKLVAGRLYKCKNCEIFRFRSMEKYLLWKLTRYLISRVSWLEAMYVSADWFFQRYKVRIDRTRVGSS